MKKIFTAIIVTMYFAALAALAITFIRDRAFVIAKFNELKLEIMSVLSRIGMTAKFVWNLPIQYYVIAIAALIIMTLVFKVIGKVFGK